MKELPILFQGEMIRAIWERRKSQTRRVIPNQQFSFGKIKVDLQMMSPNDFRLAKPWLKCPYGEPGDRLWVRETWMPDPPIDGWDGCYQWDGCGRPIDGIPIQYQNPEYVIYRADPKWMNEPLLWVPSIFMKRWAARLILENTGVREQRVQEISREDCMAEGIRPSVDGNARDWRPDEDGAHRTYRQLWDSINAKPKPILVRGVIDHYVSYPWDEIREVREYRGKPWFVFGNPWVRAISFTEISRVGTPPNPPHRKNTDGEDKGFQEEYRNVI